MATEMFRSDAPCAIMRTFTPARPSESNSCAETPGLPAMPSPTTASAATPLLTVTSLIWRATSSRANASRTARSADTASPSRMVQQIECSDDPWLIITTDTPAWCSASNARAAVPGTPIMPAPSMFRMARPLKVVTPFTGCSGPGSALMRVPGCDGLKVLRAMMGMPRSKAGPMVCGWITLAPK